MLADVFPGQRIAIPFILSECEGCCEKGVVGRTRRNPTVHESDQDLEGEWARTTERGFLRFVHMSVSASVNVSFGGGMEGRCMKLGEFVSRIEVRGHSFVVPFYFQRSRNFSGARK